MFKGSNDENKCPSPNSPAPISDAEFRRGISYQAVEAPNEGTEERKRLDKEIDALS